VIGDFAGQSFMHGCQLSRIRLKGNSDVNLVTLTAEGSSDLMAVSKRPLVKDSSIHTK